MKFIIAALVIGLCYCGTHGKPTCECPHRYVGVGALNPLYRRQRASQETDREFCHNISTRSEEPPKKPSAVVGSLSPTGPRQRKDQERYPFPGVRKTDSSELEYVDLDNMYLPYDDIEYQG